MREVKPQTVKCREGAVQQKPKIDSPREKNTGQVGEKMRDAGTSERARHEMPAAAVSQKKKQRCKCAMESASTDRTSRKCGMRNGEM